MKIANIKNKINRGHYHEVADRIEVTRQNIVNNLREHALISKKKKYYKQIDKIESMLVDLYIQIGKKM